MRRACVGRLCRMPPRIIPGYRFCMTRQLSDFIGLWTISRHIDDRRVASGMGAARLVGTCDFTVYTEGLMQDEQGLLSMPGVDTPFEAARRYMWRADAALISVFFDDGRYFHSFDPNQAHPEADHDCTPDRYEVRYDFSEWPIWRARWRVTGPRKDYVSVTTYRKSA